jgi:hypothetical protein
MPLVSTVQYAVFGGSADTVAVIVPLALAVILNVAPPEVVLIVIFPAATVFT